MTTSGSRPGSVAGAAWDALVLWGEPSIEDARNVERYGTTPPPAALAFGVTIDGTRLDAELVSVIKPVPAGEYHASLYRQDGATREVTLAWDDCNKADRRYANATFHIV